MTNPHHTTCKRKRRPLSELNLMDDFLFQEMLSQEDVNEEFCRILLGTILGKPIRKVRIIPQKNILGIDTDRHGIRMDAYIEDISGDNAPPEMDMIDAEVVPDIYDMEPNKVYEKKTLPKRMRYYHGLIDTQLLASDVDYDRLPKVVIIIILPYDPFGKNRMVYTIRNQCMEDTSIPYDDGAEKIFLYTKGTEGNPSQELRDMLRYIEKSIPENITSQNIETIHRLVEKVRCKKEVGINYMKSWEHDKMMREEGREEGFELGRNEGLEIGRNEGILALIRSCQKLNATRETAVELLAQNFNLNPGDSKAYVNKYWKE